MSLFTRSLAAIAVAGVVVACGTSSTSRPEAAAAAGLITGHVSAGPITPVSRPGHPNTRPVEGALVEALHGTERVATTRTDHAGYYQVTLQPGTYEITVSYTGFRSPVPAVRTVVVAAGQTQTVDFSLDTGIR